MTREMKPLKHWRIDKQECNEYVVSVDPQAGYIDGDNIAREAFFAGYAAAQRWISIEEELPETGQTVMTLWKKKYQMIIVFCDKESWENMSITHWQPLPPLPTK